MCLFKCIKITRSINYEFTFVWTVSDTLIFLTDFVSYSAIFWIEDIMGWNTMFFRRWSSMIFGTCSINVLLFIYLFVIFIISCLSADHRHSPKRNFLQRSWMVNKWQMSSLSITTRHRTVKTIITYWKNDFSNMDDRCTHFKDNKKRVFVRFPQHRASNNFD